jgi:lipid-binding SYLF domain-containing protein
MFEELEVEADAQAQLPEGGVGSGGRAAAKVARTDTAAGLLAGVLLDGSVLAYLVRV